jgi:hypothetical protein
MENLVNWCWFPPPFSLKSWHQPGIKEKTTYKINCKWLIFTVGPDGIEPSTPCMSLKSGFPYVYTGLYLFVPV